jgi:hypothetical protein
MRMSDSARISANSLITASAEHCHRFCGLGAMLKSRTFYFASCFASFFTFCALILSFSSAYSQVSITQYGEGDTTQPKLPQAHIERTELATLDVAREIVEMDAVPDGSHWFIIDKFGVIQTMLYDGVRNPRDFNEIPKATARLSPMGDYLIWTGLDRHFTVNGFDSTLVYVYKNQDLAGHFLGDYPTLEFSRTGKSWGVIVPYANIYQQSDRDFIIVNGRVVSKNEGMPRELSFDHAETSWAYRATTNRNERLLTSKQSLTLRTRIAPESVYRVPSDSIVYRFTPDVSFLGLLFDGVEYDHDFAHVALLNRTSYDASAQDTAHMFMTFQGKRQGMYRWILNILMDTAGKHITYFACDPEEEKRGNRGNYQRAIVVHDGKAIGKSFDAAGRIFLSPSGKHVIYSTGFQAGKVYLDQTEVHDLNQVQAAVWSPDESKIVYAATGLHGKAFVVLDGKRSPDFEAIGRIGWLANNKGVQYVALINGKLLKVKQYL